MEENRAKTPRLKRVKITGFGSRDLDFRTGGLTLLTGPNGCGKTTLLRLILSALKGYSPLRGFEKMKLSFEGRAPLRVRPGQIHGETLLTFFPDSARGEYPLNDAVLGVVNQFLDPDQVTVALYPSLEDEREIQGNSHVHPRKKALTTQGREVVVRQGDRIFPLSSLSGGEQNLLALIASLCSTAPGTVVLLDNPDVGLHITWQALLGETIRRIADERFLTVIAATHSPDFIQNHNEVEMGEG